MMKWLKSLFTPSPCTAFLLEPRADESMPSTVKWTPTIAPPVHTRTKEEIITEALAAIAELNEHRMQRPWQRSEELIASISNAVVIAGNLQAFHFIELLNWKNPPAMH